MIEELNVAYLYFLLLIVLIGIAWTINVRKTLLLVEEEHIAIKPNIVWLMAIPGINLITQFYIIKKVAQSLYNEFESHHWNTKPVVACYHIGMMMAGCSILIFLPFNTFFFWFCTTVMYFAYWVGTYILRITLIKNQIEN